MWFLINLHHFLWGEYLFLCLGDDEKINQRHQLCWNSILHVSLIPEHSSLFLLHTIPFLNQGTKFTLWSLVFHITDNGMWIVSSFSYRYITKSVVNFLSFFSFFVWLAVLQQWHFPFLIFFSICSICSSLLDANSYKLNKSGQKWSSQFLLDGSLVMTWKERVLLLLTGVFVS